MSNELRFPTPSGQTLDAYVFRVRDGKVWRPSTETFETWGTGSRAAADYKAVTLAETATGSCYYVGDFPTEITTAAEYDVQLRLRAGATPANSDIIVGSLNVQWRGAAITPSYDSDPTPICNDGLLLLSGAEGSRAISSIEDTDNPTAVLCADQYPKILKKLLTVIQPHYAMKYGDCGDPLEDEDIPASSDWVYAFDLPDDCHENVVGYQTDEDNRKARYNYRVLGSYLLTDTLSNTDADSAYLFYLFYLTDTTLMSEAFRWAIACELAYRLSGPIDPKVTLQMQQRAQDAIGTAALADSWVCRQEEGEYSWLSHRSA